MNERLDYLLSAALDGELDSAEREELDRLLPDHPEASDRSAQLASVDELVQTLSASSILSEGAARPQLSADARLEEGLAAIRTRIERDEGGAASDELAERRRRRLPSWIPPMAMAAAAVAIYLAVPQDSFNPLTDDVDTSTNRAPVPAVDISTSEERRFVDDPIALAVVFEIEEDGDSVNLVDGVSPDDFEIIETLELMEFLAARHGEGRG